MDKVTIVTVCYNAAQVIEETIISVVSQTYSNIEYIIIDGGSSDGTTDIIKQYEKKISFWTSEHDTGVYDAMNKGIRASTGKWINFMNAGDTFYSKHTIESFVSKINDKTQIAYGDTMMIWSLMSKKKKPFPLKEITHHMIFGHQSTFIATSYHKHNLFDISFKSSGDYNFFYKAYASGAVFQYIPEIVSNYEAENGISSKNIKQVIFEDARVRGENTNLNWKVKYHLKCFSIDTKNFIKRILPSMLVEKYRKIRITRFE